MTTGKETLFIQLVQEVQACTKCPRMLSSERILGHSSGNLSAKVLFIGEAPGRLGADDSLIPFHGDVTGHNFESLIDQTGITRYECFVTNAVLCTPKDPKGNNSTPTKEEVENCSSFLKRQLDLVEPRVVVTLGSIALKAAGLIEDHGLKLSDAVRTRTNWYGRTLIPLYHPGQRALVHRSFANQLADYQFVAEQIKRLGRLQTRSKSTRPTTPKVADVVRHMISIRSPISYFSLHKLFYLIECESLRTQGKRLTSSYIVRQKDGPYCVDLHISKIKKALPSLRVTSNGSTVLLHRPSGDLFEDKPTSLLTAEEESLIEEVVKRYGAMSSSDLKRCAYLTSDMRRILRLEQHMRTNMFNAPLLAK